MTNEPLITTIRFDAAENELSEFEHLSTVAILKNYRVVPTEASDETEDCMPLTHLVATRLGKKLTDVRKDGSLWWLRPDGKTQVTVEYKQNSDGSVEPLKVHTVVISTQHAAPGVAKRSEECAGYDGKEMIAPSMEQMNSLIVEHVVKKTLQETILKNGKPALTLYGDHTHLHINPSGKSHSTD